MQPARAAGSIDYDYYKRKMAEMVRSPPKDGSKMMRNAEKLAGCEAAYLNVKNELQARMRAPAGQARGAWRPRRPGRARTAR